MTKSERGYEFESWAESEVERAKLLDALQQQSATARAARENRIVITSGMPPMEQIFAHAMHTQQMILNSLTMLMLWQMQEIRKQALGVVTPVGAVLQ